MLLQAPHFTAPLHADAASAVGMHNHISFPRSETAVTEHTVLNPATEVVEHTTVSLQAGLEAGRNNHHGKVKQL